MKPTSLLALGLVVLVFFCRSGVEAGATKCYSCDVNCDNPKEQNCEEQFGPGDYVCTTAINPTLGGEYRNCLASAGVELYCNIFIQAGGSCTSCSSDLCNDGSNGAEHYSASVLVASVLVFLVAKFV